MSGSRANRGAVFPTTTGSLNYQISSQGSTQFLDDGLTILGLTLNNIDPDLSYNFRLSGNWVLARLKSGITLDNTVITLLNFDTYFDKRTNDSSGTGTGSVTNVSSTTADLTIANPTTTPAITLVSAPKLTTARTINGTSFDGTANIVVTDNTKEPLVTVGTTAQYYRGDKTFATLDKSSVGLTNVDNTSDLLKPISTATQTALNAKVNTSLIGVINGVASLDATGKVPSSQLPPASTAVTSVNSQTGVVVLTKTDVGLTNVDNTTDLLKPVSTATQTALNGKENTVIAGTASQYYRGDKTFVTLDKVAAGLPNVDNTSDISKPISTATQTALNAIPQTNIVGLATSLSGKENIANKAVDLSTPDNTKYPTTQAVVNAISSIASGQTYKGTWNASTNTPVLVSSAGVAGSRYTVSVNGTTNLDGITDWKAKDWAVYNGVSWEKVDNTDNIDSVNGQIGTVVLTKIDIGLTNVDNTSDINKPVSTATQTALNTKVTRDRKSVV